MLRPLPRSAGEEKFYSTMPISFASRESWGCKRRIALTMVRRESRCMRDGVLLTIAAGFTLAGFVKGVIGRGLPTISMGLLALVMPPMQAAALLVVPSLLTNVWQMWSGPSPAAVTARLWPMMLAVCAGTWAASGLMNGSYASVATALLGLTLALYAASGLLTVRLAVPERHEWWLGPAAGR